MAPYLVLKDHMVAGSNTRHSIGRAYADRFAIVDLATGKMVASKLYEDRQLTCWPAGGARIWCDENQQVSVLSVPASQKFPPPMRPFKT